MDRLPTMLPKRDWAEMTWPDFSAADTACWIAVLPLAATEQHGRHLPLGVDSYIAEAYLARVRAQLPADLPATFLPTQWIGQSDEHVAFPGTLTFSGATVVRAWTEIGESVARAGVKKLVLVTSHGGNVSAMEMVARDLRVRLGMLVVCVGWHRFGYPDGAYGGDERRHGIHGGEVETSLMLAGRRDTVRMDQVVAEMPVTVAMAREFKWLGAFRPASFGWMTQDLHPSGAVGDASAATREKGEATLALGAKGFVELLAEIDRFDLSRLGDGPLARS
jgi:creatinine amidohydrolase